MSKNIQTTKIKQPKEKNYVAEMTILTQMIEKENKNTYLFENFHIRPNNIKVITDKVNVDPKKYFIKTKDMKQEDIGKLDENLKKQLRQHFQVPKKKYKHPQTESQEIGWIKPFEQHGVKNSKETTFDTAYIRLKGYSQFSNKSKV